MKISRRILLLIFTLSLVFAMLACGFGGSTTEPTQAPAQAEPTSPPPEPTAVPPEPETPTEESVDMPADAPTEETIEEPTEQPTAEPLEEPATPPPGNELYIKEVNGFVDDLGSLHIVGLVVNNTNRAVDNVEVEVQIFDSSENLLFTEVTGISLYTLASGETSPFSYWVYEDLPDADNYVATIVGQSAAEVERAALEIDGVTFIVDDGGDLHVTGNLVNNSGNPVEVSGLAAATFDENGDLYTADSHSVLTRYLDPGEDGPFRVTMTGPKGGTANINEYEIFVDAVVIEPTESFDLVFSETHYNYLDSYASFHLVGEVTNNHNEYLTVSLIGGIYDQDGNVLDAATTDVPTYSIAPGETLPYDLQYWGPLNYKSDTFSIASSYTVQWDPYWTWTSSTQYIDLSSQNDKNEVSSFLKFCTHF